MFIRCHQVVGKLLSECAMHVWIIRISFEKLCQWTIYNFHVDDQQYSYDHILIMMQKFKIQQLKSGNLHNNQRQHKNSKHTTYEPANLKLSVTQVGYLNYPIESLISIIQQHFDQEPPSANIVCKALKIISISLKDLQLKNGLQQIIMKNKEKRQSLFLLVKYWVAFTKGNKLPQIILKFHENVSRSIISSTISCFLFSSTDNKQNLPQISDFIQSYIQHLDKSEKSIENNRQFEKLIGDIKNDYLLIDFSLESLLRVSIKLIRQPMQKFLRLLLPWIFQKQNCQKQLFQIIKSYIEYTKEEQLKTQLSLNQSNNSHVPIFEIVEQFFHKFMYLSESFTKNLKIILTGELVMKLWLSLMKKNYQSKQDKDKNKVLKLEPLIKSTIKQYINHSQNGKQYWEIFSTYYDKPTSNYNTSQVKYQLLGLATQLNGQNLLAQFITKIYLYNYFVGKNFEIESENIFVKQYLSQNHNNQLAIKHKISHQNYEALTQMLHGLQNCSSKGGINVITINKIYAVQDWPKMSILSNQYEANIKKLQKITTNFENFFTKLKMIFKKLQEKCDKKGQKIELVYSVLIVKDLKTNNQLKLTLDQIQLYGNVIESEKFQQSNEQFKSIYKQNKIIKKSQSISENKQQNKQQHPIVFEAKTIKLLKKSKKSLLLQQICTQIGLKSQKMEAILQKLINKGFVDEDESQKYYYLP